MSELFAVCATYEVDDGDARGFVLARLDETGARQRWPILITRKANTFYGFENACPHQGARLDGFPGEFMDEEGNFLTCSRHHAKFDLDTGQCFIGPCQGQALKSIKVVIDDGDVCLVDVELAEEDGLDIEDPNEVPEVLITGD
ncbi:Rieske 2Fe-2S domain-containing protein [Xanthobacter dioxanivorans]|uniref:Rieske 2Fe-2S domain-containing protein n=1 Tax=Xanthobacter dioxanivorans TaxID=2528964 RepID=A0A974PMF3_9HYPH|nr:Rieske 2Fe-2S domain-containing protein [Xanthobacter dioxanivorans]QRG05884.1 Rieske 2Fe-2S domain-containing protein [Xanthobacter dioxanivorans]